MKMVELVPSISFPSTSASMKVAVVGCCHGKLDTIYKTIQDIEIKNNYKVDLLLCCGDFQAMRSQYDLNSFACPKKYRTMGDFYQYYHCIKTAPIPTIFIGGNHESSYYLMELPLGGYVAPNIYYLGYSGIVCFNGLRIGGLSGIYKGYNYTFNHYESVPLDKDTIRSVYHQRLIDIWRFKKYSTLNNKPIDIFLSHDWPANIVNYGNIQNLIKHKPQFSIEIKQGTLGSPALQSILSVLKPMNWYSAHLHCKYTARYPHLDINSLNSNHNLPSNSNSTSNSNSNSNSNDIYTDFMALDKCLPNRDYLEIFHFPDYGLEKSIYYDIEWLTVLRKTAPFYFSSQYQKHRVELPLDNDNNYKITKDHVKETLNLFNSLKIPSFDNKSISQSLSIDSNDDSKNDLGSITSNVDLSSSSTLINSPSPSQSQSQIISNPLLLSTNTTPKRNEYNTQTLSLFSILDINPNDNSPEIVPKIPKYNDPNEIILDDF